MEQPSREGGVARLFETVLDNLLVSRSSALGWLARRRARKGLAPGSAGNLSPNLSRILAAAAEQLLSPQLTFAERGEVFHAVLQRYQRMTPVEQRALCAHLDLLDRLVPLLGRFGRRFENLSPEARRRCLQACEGSRWHVLAEGQTRLRHLVQMAFMECAGIWPETKQPVARTESIRRLSIGRLA